MPRESLPSVMLDRNSVTVWSILKHCIGKELSKITMPVEFNEPISFLQRLAEYLEYIELIDEAAQHTDPLRRIECVLAFAASAAASNWERVGKPFNPLLGETYQLDRPDLGFRLICEQVSHHPPVSAFYAESEKFEFFGAIHPKIKFWGKSVEVIPIGNITLRLKEYNETYEWNYVNVLVHNILIGKIWNEHSGDLNIRCEESGLKAKLHFKEAGWYGKDLCKLEGTITNIKESECVRYLYGKWTDSLYSVDPEIWKNKQVPVSSPLYISFFKAFKKDPKDNKSDPSASGKQNEDPSDTVNLNLPTQRCLWKARGRPSTSKSYYHFSYFTLGLNEISNDISRTLVPTDCRLRPDIRHLEHGRLDDSSKEKHRLEEKQRSRKKEMKRQSIVHTPRWFNQGKSSVTDWTYKRGFWQHIAGEKFYENTNFF